MNTFYIVRHGETENNRAKRLSGWIDTPLTDTGLQPTKLVTVKLAKLQIDEIYSSDVGRAFITAYELARGLNFTKEIKRLPGLREVNYGDAANMYSAEAYRLYPRLDRDTDYMPPNGESLDHMQKRVFQAINQLNEAHTNATIILVCHSGVMAALRASHIGQDFGEHNISEAYPHEFVGKFTFENNAVTSFEEFVGEDQPTQTNDSQFPQQSGGPLWPTTTPDVPGGIVSADQTTIVVTEEESTGVETANLHPLPVIQPLSDTTPKQ